MGGEQQTSYVMKPKGHFEVRNGVTVFVPTPRPKRTWKQRLIRAYEVAQEEHYGKAELMRRKQGDKRK